MDHISPTDQTGATLKHILLLALACAWQVVSAETIQVKYHGPVSLDSFTCSDVRENSDVTRICYDAAVRYMVIRLRVTYYHYCEIDAKTVQGLQAAPSKRQYFEARIKGTGSDGPFDCRTHPIPKKYRL
jgi:hypothetical protein